MKTKKLSKSKKQNRGAKAPLKNSYNKKITSETNRVEKFFAEYASLPSEVWLNESVDEIKKSKEGEVYEKS